ncbi:hypothetical protein ACN47E_004243 [Coniothyrium glycines]
MASTGGRIPAWRRLGLALNNEDQSHATAGGSHASQGRGGREPAHNASEAIHDNLQSPPEPAINGKSSRLGKRKHQTDPAEEHVQQHKKTKALATGDRAAASHETAADAHAVDVDTVAAPQHDTPAADFSQPKGDPNYRKKKSNPAKRQKERRQIASAPASSPDNSRHANNKSVLLASTEASHVDPATAPFATPRKPSRNTTTTRDNTGSPPPQTDRRKSVAFTPDTKTADGNSGQELFKKWVAEQKGTGAVSAPPPVSDFTLHSLIAEEEKTARRNGQLNKAPPEGPPIASASTSNATAPVKSSISAATTSVAVKGKKKDPSIYVAYLEQYYSDRDNWKFNKAKQNDVVDNALNIFRIPNQEALLEYVAGLRGAGVIQRLQERCNTTLKELDREDAKMDDTEARKAALEDAEQERIAKERNRREVEGDVEAFGAHPHSDGYIRRLRRARATALLTALGRTAPILPANPQSNGINPIMDNVAPRRDSKKRKRRGEVSSDESSSDSSSDEESSSSDSESDRDESDSSSSSDSDVDSSSGSDSDNESD